MKKAPLNALQAQLDTERKMVSFDSYDMTVRQILEMFEEGAIYVPPEYQRQFVWKEDRESQLIESIFLGIPVPSLFMATNVDSSWEIVDGVQRLSTIAHYMSSKSDSLKKIGRSEALRIRELEKLSAMDDMAYSDLSKPLQLLFQTRPIRVTVLNDKSDLSVRFDLFERLNTGGVSLTNQEIRNCIFRGPLNDDIKKLANSKEFKSVVKLKDSDWKNGTSEEYVLRFFAYLDVRDEFEHSVKGFLNDYMKARASKGIAPSKQRLFRDAMASLSAAFPDGLTRGQASTTSAVLFEAMAVGIAVAIKAGKKISKNKIRSLIDDRELKRFTTGATNSRKMLLGRIDRVAQGAV